MTSLKKRLIAVATLGMSMALGGCMGDYGYGSVGYASGYYDSYGPGISYGVPYGYAPGGWYNDFYYPGTGSYVFDRSGRRSRWSDSQRLHWQNHRREVRSGIRQPDRPRYGRREGQVWQGRGDGRPAISPRRDKEGFRGRPAVRRQEGQRSAAGEARRRSPAVVSPRRGPEGTQRGWGGAGRGAGRERGRYQQP